MVTPLAARVVRRIEVRFDNVPPPVRHPDEVRFKTDARETARRYHCATCPPLSWVNNSSFDRSAFYECQTRREQDSEGRSDLRIVLTF